MNKKRLIIIIAIIVLLLVFGGILWFVKSKELKTDSAEVKEIYSYIGSNDLEICNGLSNYSDDTIDFDKTKNDMRICLAYSLLDTDDSTVMKIDKSKKNNTCSINDKVVFATDNYEDNICTITKIDASKISDQYKKMYNKEIEDYVAFQYDNSTICYYDNNNYYCGLSETYNYSVGAEPHTYRSIYKAVKDKNNIVIYDYFLKTAGDECFSTYSNDSKNEKCSNNLKTNIDYKFLKKYGAKYKHTFAEGDNGYYWVKSEPVK